jgi:hypothetical protein
MIARACMLLVLLTGCGGDMGIRDSVNAGTYLTYEHAHTDAAARAARQRADKQCAYNKRIAVRTSSTCSLTSCTTHFHCMDQESAARENAPASTKK